MPIFFIAFIVVPIVEMVILIEVGGIIGVLPTVGLVLLTAVVGAAMLKQQGMATLLRANQRMEGGELPAREMAEGLLLAIGGALLLTPGFVTDGVGFTCLFPLTRRWLAGRMMNRMIVQGNVHMGGTMGSGPDWQGPRRDRYGNIIIEGEYERDDDSVTPETDDSQSRDPDRLPRD